MRKILPAGHKRRPSSPELHRPTVAVAATQGLETAAAASENEVVVLLGGSVAFVSPPPVEQPDDKKAPGNT